MDKINNGPWAVELVPDKTTPPLVGFQVTAQDPKIGRVVICEMFAKPYCVTVRQDTADLIAAAPDLLWLVERAASIRSAPNWTKAERDRSWADWDAKRAEVLAKINPVEG